MTKAIEFKVSYNGGMAADGKLGLYDAGESLRGLSRALAITTHAFINEGQVRVRANRVEGADIYIQAPQRGSFQEAITVAFSDPVVANIGVSVVGAAFYDFLRWTWKAASGIQRHEPETSFVQKLSRRREPVLGEIASGLESAMHQLHRPIQTEAPMTISILRPRIGEILRLDQSSLAYVSAQTEEELTKNILGNVTKYNILSGFGRFFDDKEDRTISFDLDSKILGEHKRLLTWSLHERSEGREGKLLLIVRRVLTAHGELKRYKVFSVQLAA